MSIDYNPIIGDPKLSDVLQMFRKQMFLSLNCHAVGTVQSFNSALQTANVQIDYQKTIYIPGPGGVYQQQNVNYPINSNCPVIVLGGGGANLTFPIAKEIGRAS